MTFCLEDFALSSRPKIDLEGFKKKWLEKGGIPLSEKQWETVEEVSQIADSKGQALLKGPAGTGKTTVMVATVIFLTLRGIRVQVTAPTHKAVKVLADKIEPLSKKFGAYPPEPRTIHSVLSLVPKRVIPGEPEGYRRNGVLSLEGIDLIIVDECSMVGQELHRYIVNDTEEHGISLLFSGDSYQLKPVNEKGQSLTFCTDHQMTLKDVVRHGGPILELATKVRRSLNGRLPSVESSSDEISKVLAYGNADTLVNSWLGKLEENRDSVIFLCWTNNVRRTANGLARKRLYGEGVPTYVKGDKLLALSSYEKKRKVLIQNNAEVIVEGAFYIEDYCPLTGFPYVYNCWLLTLDNNLTVHVMDEDEREKFNKQLGELSDEIRKNVDSAEAVMRAAKGTYAEKAKEREYNAARGRWQKEYFSLRDAFADLDYSYAITIHKSQGSTYDSVFVHDDFKQSDEKMQLFYVALTRAAEEVHLIGG
jgi:exodeoxyribonuclease-5